MSDFSLRITSKPAERDFEKKTINKHLSELPFICLNSIRAGILYLLVNTPETGHAIKVEHIAYRLGIHHRLALYHLEKLTKWDLVVVRKAFAHGKKERRSIWGLNLYYPNWIFEVYSYINNMYSENDLKALSSRNVYRRKRAGLIGNLM